MVERRERKLTVAHRRRRAAVNPAPVESTRRRAVVPRTTASGSDKPAPCRGGRVACAASPRITVRPWTGAGRLEVGEFMHAGSSMRRRSVGTASTQSSKYPCPFVAGLAARRAEHVMRCRRRAAGSCIHPGASPHADRSRHRPVDDGPPGGIPQSRSATGLRPPPQPGRAVDTVGGDDQVVLLGSAAGVDDSVLDVDDTRRRRGPHDTGGQRPRAASR